MGTVCLTDNNVDGHIHYGTYFPEKQAETHLNTAHFYLLSVNFAEPKSARPILHIVCVGEIVQ